MENILCCTVCGYTNLEEMMNGKYHCPKCGEDMTFDELSSIGKLKHHMRNVRCEHCWNNFDGEIFMDADMLVSQCPYCGKWSLVEVFDTK